VFTAAAVPVAQTAQIKVSLKDALQIVEQRFKIVLGYRKNLVENLSVSSDAWQREETLESSLESLLGPFGLTYKKIGNRTFVLKEKSSGETGKSSLAPASSSGNDKTGPDRSRSGLRAVSISGRVTDAQGAALPGVNVIEKGTSTGTVTDQEGRYQLSVSGNATVVFSYIGYLSQEVAVNNRAVIDIVLAVDVKTLEEIVVVGYGTQKRSDLTGSIASVGSKELKDFSVGRADQALAGKVAGVQVKLANGRPGASPQINVRGFNSISQSNAPLFVIDGVPGGDLGTLNPNDIESIDILKDASAAAIYGSRASNGVVIVTTRRGKSGKGTIGFNTYYGWQSLERKVDMMNSQEIARFQYQSLVNRNADEGNPMGPDPTRWRRPVAQTILDVLNGTNTTDTDWQDEIFRVAPMQSYQLSLGGGAEKLRYYLSGEYLDQDGIVLNSSFKRYSLRINLDGNITDRLRVSASLNPSFTLRTEVPTDGQGGNANSIIGSALLAQPFYAPYKENSEYANLYGTDAGVDIENPVATAREILDRRKGFNFLSSVSGEYDILNGLKAKVLVGTIIGNNRNKYFKPVTPAFVLTSPYGSSFSSLRVNWLTEYTLSYEKTWLGKHNLSAVAGYSVQKENYEEASFFSDNFPNNLVNTLNAVSGQIDGGGAVESTWTLLSMLGRVNYNYSGKYYLTTSLRRDGSSRFGTNNKWGLFPSVALAWRISEESFMARLPFISNLKLRVSAGLSGNNNIPDYEYLPTASFNAYPIGGQVAGGYYPDKISNPDLAWERQREVNAGFDLGVLNERITLSADYYVRNNKDLLLRVSVPGVTGFGSALQNIGEVENRGLELSANAQILPGVFKWNAGVNFSFYRNKVKALGPGGDPLLLTSGYQAGFSHITQVGQPVGMFWGWITDGVIQNEEELARAPIFNPGGNSRTRVGDFRFRDLDGNGIIDGDDRTIMGSPHPDYMFGVNNTFSFGGFELNVGLQGVVGGQLLHGERIYIANTRGRRNQMKLMNDYWVSAEQPGNGQIPRPNNDPTGNNRGGWSTFFLEDGTFVRVNTITLGYTIPAEALRVIRLSNVRLYANATNPFTFTRYTGYNPDVSHNENARVPGVDWNNFPTARVFSLGLNATF
jgi:TonB-linked SusC/RagA family outer membrane protein